MIYQEAEMSLEVTDLTEATPNGKSIDYNSEDTGSALGTVLTKSLFFGTPFYISKIIG